MTKPNLTPMEQEVYDAIEGRGGSMYADELRYYMDKDSTIQPSSYGGIVASLQKKGYVTCLSDTDGRDYIESTEN